jgi:hypothetical protein
MHEADTDFPVGDLLQHARSTNKLALTPRRVAVCKHCRGMYAGEINEFGEAGPDGVCPARVA